MLNESERRILICGREHRPAIASQSTGVFIEPTDKYRVDTGLYDLEVIEFFEKDAMLPLSPRPVKKRRIERQCALPGCEKMTTHNGGYCCAEHCQKHRELRHNNRLGSDASPLPSLSKH